MSISFNYIGFQQFSANSTNEITASKPISEVSENPAAKEVASTLILRTHDKANRFAKFNEVSESAELIHFACIDFEFVSDIALRFQQELIKYPFANEGCFFVASYFSENEHCMLFAYVGVNWQPAIDNAGVINQATQLSLNDVSLIAEVNLTAWIRDTNKINIRYVSPKRSISDFWLDFFEAEIAVDSRIQNLVLIQAIQDFIDENAKLDAQDKHTARKAAFAYCREKHTASEFISLKELSEEISDQPDQFSSYIEKNGYELEPEFPVHSASLKRLVKLQGIGGGINLTFDSMLLNERVFYDAETDTLTLKGTPPALRDQLRRTLRQL